MCGIVGYTGKKCAKDVVISALKNLEYRGYDSSGIAIFENDKFNTYKSVGRIKNLESLLEKKDFSNSNIAIGHTRWATHGIPNTENAHPHRHGKISLVHNGIIENYLQLKNMLIEKGFSFYSQTDTEVATCLIDYLYQIELEKNSQNYSKEKLRLNAISKACNQIKGSYAFGIVFDDDSKSIYAAKKDSPLLIGISDTENFIASDISAFLEYTNKYILLKDMQYAIVSNDKVQIFNNDLNAIDYEEKIANFSISNYQKNGYEHFMLKEMHEQPQAIYNIFNSFFENKNSTYESINLFSYSKIDIVACGSAMHAGLVGKYLFESYLNIPTNVEIASEYRYKKLLPKKDTLVIIISQSGETADSLAALKLAKSCGATTLAICNVAFSTISREANITLNTSAGPEIAVATTKGYTTQIAMLTTLVLNELRRKDELDSLDLKLLHSNLKDISKIFDEVFNRKNEFLEIANKLKDKNDLFFIGRGLDYYLCMEGSLKLKEISYMHSEAYSAGELKHGTISLITEDMPVIAIATDEDLILKTISNVQEVKSRGAYTIFITTEELAKKYDLKFNDITLILKTLHPLLKSNLIALSLQLIAYETAKIKGCNIDKPKNLAKSVTVE